ALQPEAFFWGHATIFDNVVQTADLFAHPLTLEEKRRFYDESRCWYRLYGVNDRAMPKDWESFNAYFDDVCARVLEPTPAARHLLDRIHGRVPTILPWIPRVVSRGITPPAFKLLWFITLGTLPDAVRRSLGYSWDPDDDEALERIKRFVRRAWPRLPRRIRYLPIAYRAIRAAERARCRRTSGAEADQPFAGPECPRS
ncbi:MAG TPA: oxygenase MpaB family protein, partial [Polyangiaceae bacterium]|nr:oxygenase MpaB family protein [Polyangiaceae bacterium]